MNIVSHIMSDWKSGINSTGKTNSNKPDIALKIWHEKAADKKKLHCA